MELINEKLSTGYHGVNHLFKSNDIQKNGRISKYIFFNRRIIASKIF